MDIGKILKWVGLYILIQITAIIGLWPISLILVGVSIYIIRKDVREHRHQRQKRENEEMELLRKQNAMLEQLLREKEDGR